MSLDLVLRNDEKAVFSLRALYGKYGYSQYKMSKFEEYDLYVKNKDFLVSENVITFTNTDGKLMALKPDVTLSIIKNSKDGDGVQKVFYDENVYRVSKGTKSFKEILQAGLECIGNVDDYLISEVLLLAEMSLKSISNDFVLDVSSLDVINGIMDDMGLSFSVKKEVMTFLAEKNAKGIEQTLERVNANKDLTELLVSLTSTYGKPEKIRQKFDGYRLSENTQIALDKLIATVQSLIDLGEGDNVNIDFSVVNSLNYYNGIVFNGFISGIPTGILSGGQYDNLMKIMGRKSKAIGFAVYLDELIKYNKSENLDVDVALIYGKTPVSAVNKKVKEFIDQGKSVIALETLPEKLKCKQTIYLEKE